MRSLGSTFACLLVFWFFALDVFASGRPNQFNDDPSHRLFVGFELGEPPRRPFDEAAFIKALADGADVNFIGETGEPVILKAVIAHAYLADSHPDKAGLFRSIRTLLLRGANPNVPDRGGFLPLMMAVHRAVTGSSDHPIPDLNPIYKLLLEESPVPATLSINSQNYAGSTSVHYVARNGMLPILDMLLKYGGSLTVKDERGLTPIGSVFGTKLSVATVDALLERLTPEERNAERFGLNSAGSSALIAALRARNSDLFHNRGCPTDR
jgi:ankyrin repeat protein